MRQSEASVIGKAQRTAINGGQPETAVPSRTTTTTSSSRPGLWPWHGQQGEWAGLLHRHVGRSLQRQMCPPTDLRRGLQDGRGRLQMQRCHVPGTDTRRPPPCSPGIGNVYFPPLSNNYWIVFKWPCLLVLFWQLSKDHEAMSHVLFGRSLRLNVALTLWRRNPSEFVAYLIRYVQCSLSVYSCGSLGLFWLMLVLFCCPGHRDTIDMFGCLHANYTGWDGILFVCSLISRGHLSLVCGVWYPFFHTH